MSHHILMCDRVSYSYVMYSCVLELSNSTSFMLCITLCIPVWLTSLSLHYVLLCDRVIYLTSGSFSYKCDNCNKKFTEKNMLENHIALDHIKCSICKKVFPTISSLNIHITAVHDNLKMKHNIEREPSLKNHKIRRPAWYKFKFCYSCRKAHVNLFLSVLLYLYSFGSNI